MRVDPSTGDRTVLSGCTAEDPATFACTALLGTGPSFGFPGGIAVEADGALVVVDEGLTGRVIRVNPVTGDRVLVSGLDSETNTSLGSGPLLLFPADIAVAPDGALIVGDRTLGVVQVDPLTGNRTILSRSVRSVR